MRGAQPAQGRPTAFFASFGGSWVEPGDRRFLTIYLATAATGLGATLLPSAGLRETITIIALVLIVLLIIAILETPPRKTS